MSGNLAKEQKITIITLSAVTLILAVSWCINEALQIFITFNFEPYVTGCASFIPVLTLWWPFRARNKASRLSGKVTLNLSQSKVIKLGSGEALFEPTFSENSSTSVHLITRYNPDLLGSAVLSKEINDFKFVKDASSFGISTEDKSPDKNDVFVLKNRYGNYALVKVISIGDASGSVAGKEIEVEYLINPNQGVNFS
ncbi:hypothetical protein BZ160_04620 [Pantoea vagans]|nr:hypothetical protein [Pantoea vagans]OQV43408.1 hypothetical protein BZ160_04620 [Pantoea vagans]